MTAEIAIVGGGAAGLIAGIAAKRTAPDLRLVILERMDRPGKKLLATGNGRCNYTNSEVNQSNFYGDDSAFCVSALNSFSNKDAVTFFRELGVFPRVEEEGKIFPYSGNASSVLDALRYELERLRVPIRTGFDAVSISRKGKNFLITARDQQTVTAQKIVVSAGGKASPALGADGSGYALLTSLGHHCTALSPAITQIRTEGADVKPLQGIKFFGNASALGNGRVLATLTGEVLFTAYGLSGPPIFQLSSKVALKLCDVISLDLMPELAFHEIHDLLNERKLHLNHLTMESFFSGLLNKRIGNLIARRAGIEKLSYPVSQLTSPTLKAMASLIKDLQFPVAGLNGWEHAQVTAGGIVTSEFDPGTMQSKLYPDLYAAGEILDIFGDCGGFNLQWAWSSGYVAGKHAAMSTVRFA